MTLADLVNWDNGVGAGVLGFIALMVWLKFQFVERPKAKKELELEERKANAEIQRGLDYNANIKEYQTDLLKYAEDRGKRDTEANTMLRTITDSTVATASVIGPMKERLDSIDRRLDQMAQNHHAPKTS